MKIKKLSKYLLALILFLLPRISLADSFDSLDMDVTIDKNGVGSVEEVWQIDEDERDYTERYKLIENLRGIKIEDFSLTSSSLGKNFSEMNPWDSDLSFEEKAYKYGRSDREDGTELIWGISKYGKNTYELSYKINPVIIGLEDSDMLFFQFVGENFDPKPERVNINIKGFEPFDRNVKMWGFGLVGDIHNIDGNIVLKSKGEVDYTTIMLKFPKGYFNTSYKEDKTFDDYANMAVKGSKWEESEGEANTDPIPWYVKVIAPFVILLGLGSILLGVRANKLHFDENNIRNAHALKKAKTFKDQYFRDIPYPSHIEDTYLLAEKAYHFEISPGNYMNAFILKWIYDKNIEIEANKKNDKNAKIRILDRPSNMGKMEEAFFDIIEKSQEYSKDGLVSNKNIQKYFEENDEITEDFYEDFLPRSRDALKAGDYLKDIRFEKKFAGTRREGKELEVTPKGISLYENLIKFRNYLEDYSLIAERDANEVYIWDYFLIYAAIYGISDKVFKNLEKTYPNYSHNSVFNYYMITNSRNYSTITQANIASFSSAGAGGSTSFGGGGGSFGGGGGGGR
ncbi:DUF2207 domain-containing protein [Anaerococcus sp.]|uniref:DUF2207 family protein n=1 Tax=Anaerococcus sp. TaxID=1872515 RepID=UPI0027BB0EC3|nr:DUF2207 domain-containing protein [Anaerococcus sp.]